jgi:hypothetical protein
VVLTLDRPYDSVRVIVAKRAEELGSGQHVRWRVPASGTFYVRFILKYAAQSDAQSESFEGHYSLQMRVSRRT